MKEKLALENKIKVIRNRIGLCKANLSFIGTKSSPTLDELDREESKLVRELSALDTHDWTPNPPGSGGGTPPVAMLG